MEFDLEQEPIPVRDRKSPRINLVSKKVFVVEFVDIYGNKKRKNKFTQHAADILVFKRQFINKYAPYDQETFFQYIQTDYDEGFTAYGQHKRDYKELKSRWLRFVKFTRRKANSRSLAASKF